MKSITLGIILVVVLSASAAMAGDLSYEENRALLSKIDRNSDGFLQTDEVDLGLWYRASKNKVDLKNPPTAQQVAQDSAKDVNFKLLKYDFEKKFGKKEKYLFDEVKAEVEFRLKPDIRSPKKDGNSKGQFYLRRSLAKIPKDDDSDQSGSAMSQSAAKFANEGAMFSYGHAFRDGSDELLAQGVIAYATPFKESNQTGSGMPGLSRSLVSLEFSRVHFEGEGKPKDSSPRFLAEDSLLNAGATYETLVNWPQGFAGFTGSLLTFNAFWKTDMDFESHIPEGEVEWTFYNGKLGFGSFEMMSDYIWFRINPKIHADGGYVLEDGKWTKSVRGDAFAHIGPQIGVTLMLLPNSSVFKDNPLILSADYGQFFKITSQAKEIKIFTLDMSWYIRKPGTGSGGPSDPGVALTFTYRDYKNVENKSDDNSLIAGIAIGF